MKYDDLKAAPAVWNNWMCVALRAFPLLLDPEAFQAQQRNINAVFDNGHLAQNLTAHMHVVMDCYHHACMAGPAITDRFNGYLAQLVDAGLPLQLLETTSGSGVYQFHDQPWGTPIKYEHMFKPEDAKQTTANLKALVELVSRLMDDALKVAVAAGHPYHDFRLGIGAFQQRVAPRAFFHILHQQIQSSSPVLQGDKSAFVLFAGLQCDQYPWAALINVLAGLVADEKSNPLSDVASAAWPLLFVHMPLPENQLQKTWYLQPLVQADYKQLGDGEDANNPEGRFAWFLAQILFEDDSKLFASSPWDPALQALAACMKKPDVANDRTVAIQYDVLRTYLLKFIAPLSHAYNADNGAKANEIAQIATSASWSMLAYLSGVTLDSLSAENYPKRSNTGGSAVAPVRYNRYCWAQDTKVLMSAAYALLCYKDWQMHSQHPFVKSMQPSVSSWGGIFTKPVTVDHLKLAVTENWPDKAGDDPDDSDAEVGDHLAM